MYHNPSPPIHVEEFNHSKGEGIWDRLDVDLLCQSQTQGRVFKLDTVQDEDKTTTYMPIVVILPVDLGPIFLMRGESCGSCM